jgi:hypothetical protein
MKDIYIKDNELLLVKNLDEYNEVRHLLRNPNMIMEEKHFPVYFEPIESVTRGRMIGITWQKTGTKEINPEIIEITH